MQDYLVQFEVDGEKDNIVITIEDYDMDIMDIEEYAEEFISDKLEVGKGDIFIFDLTSVNKECNIEDLLLDNM